MLFITISLLSLFIWMLANKSQTFDCIVKYRFFSSYQLTTKEKKKKLKYILVVKYEKNVRLRKLIKRIK